MKLTHSTLPSIIMLLLYHYFHTLLSPGTAEPVGVKNNGDGTHTVHYTPAQDGPYTVAVKYADQEVPHRYGMNKTTKQGSACKKCMSFTPSA